MSAVYAESSAVLAWLLGEPASGEVKKAIDAAEDVATSVLTVLEIERALIRGSKQKVFSEAAGERLRGMFAKAVRTWTMMEISEEVLKGAARVFPGKPIRTLDALHLSTALLLVQAFPDLHVLTLDKRIESNAQALGLL